MNLLRCMQSVCRRGSSMPWQRGPNTTIVIMQQRPHSSIVTIEPNEYLEKLFDVDLNQWLLSLQQCQTQQHMPTYLTWFQRYLDKCRASELVRILEVCNKFNIRENAEGIDVYHVVYCEMVYKLMHVNPRALSITEISHLVKLMHGVKFNKTSLHPDVAVPICEANRYGDINYSACDSCRKRFGQLLLLSGTEMTSLLTLLLGRSLILQTASAKRLHENCIIPYLVLVASHNNMQCAGVIASLLQRYQRVILKSKSLRNLAIVLHTIKKVNVRAFPLKRKVTMKIAGEFQQLCQAEKSEKALFAAFGQLIMANVAEYYSGSLYMRITDMLLHKILNFVAETHSKLNKQESAFLKSQLAILFSSANVERFRLRNMIQQNRNVLQLENNLIDTIGVVTKETFQEQHWRTSDIHTAVASTLDYMGIQCQVETPIYPYLVDLTFSKVVIEVDGPYHYVENGSKRLFDVLNIDILPAQRYNLNTMMKDKLLRKMGYHVIHLPFNEWPDTRQQQFEYLRALNLYSYMRPKVESNVAAYSKPL